MKHKPYVFFLTFVSLILTFIAEVNAKPSIDFSRTLLIINFNHPYYKSIDFIKEIYSPNFPHIVFYGEKSDPRVIQNQHYFGWYSQNVIADAMIRWPNFEGYICLQDDCFMNFWNYERLDKNKIWLHHNFFHLNLESDAKTEWSWWNRDCGRAALLKTYPYLPDANKKILADNLGPNFVVGGVSDMVYIPARFRDNFIQLSPLFNQVFVEIAIPTMLCCLEDRGKWECLNYIWGLINLRNDYSPKFDWIHPIKFSSSENRKIVWSILRKQGFNSKINDKR